MFNFGKDSTDPSELLQYAMRQKLMATKGFEKDGGSIASTYGSILCDQLNLEMSQFRMHEHRELTTSKNWFLNYPQLHQILLRHWDQYQHFDNEYFINWTSVFEIMIDVIIRQTW